MIPWVDILGLLYQGPFGMGNALHCLWLLFEVYGGVRVPGRQLPASDASLGMRLANAAYLDLEEVRDGSGLHGRGDTRILDIGRAFEPPRDPQPVSVSTVRGKQVRAQPASLCFGGSRRESTSDTGRTGEMFG